MYFDAHPRLPLRPLVCHAVSVAVVACSIGVPLSLLQYARINMSSSIKHYEFFQIQTLPLRKIGLLSTVGPVLGMWRHCSFHSQGG
ncbi:hypothetical protein B296_00011173 [Ensete ventricosum]|uniref:Uncharacterized protein n=1 Tax=Ensete ventricosum TaxID=4639 RepID=A0A427B4E2_ENSVE|nr:hypothetical protein B296_00011173 [Ensete ventricosum]